MQTTDTSFNIVGRVGVIIAGLYTGHARYPHVPVSAWLVIPIILINELKYYTTMF